MKSISVFVNAVWNHFSLAKEAFKHDPQTQLFLGMMSSDHCLVELFLQAYLAHKKANKHIKLKNFSCPCCLPGF